MTDMTIHSIAGFCNEKALWKLLADLSSILLKETSNVWKVITPEMVIIDGEDFRLSNEAPHGQSTEFYPPEGAGNSGSEGLVWSLAAIVCYASSGHYVFGGRGGSYQRSHPKVELPTLKKEHSGLAALVKRSLCYTSSQRISLDDLHTTAVQGFESNAQMSRVKRMSESSEYPSSSDVMNDTWLDKMG